MGNGCSQSLVKQDLQVNTSKQRADSEKMKEIDFSHCACKYSFFKCKASTCVQKILKKSKEKKYQGC